MQSGQSGPGADGERSLTAPCPLVGRDTVPNTFVTHALEHPSTLASSALFRPCPVSSSHSNTAARSTRGSARGAGPRAWGARSLGRAVVPV
jgi:hypothetical protein